MPKKNSAGPEKGKKGKVNQLKGVKGFVESGRYMSAMRAAMTQGGG